jgi:hypothetical protein
MNMRLRPTAPPRAAMNARRLMHPSRKGALG